MPPELRAPGERSRRPARKQFCRLARWPRKPKARLCSSVSGWQFHRCRCATVERELTQFALRRMRPTIAGRLQTAGWLDERQEAAWTWMILAIGETIPGMHLAVLIRQSAPNPGHELPTYCRARMPHNVNQAGFLESPPTPAATALTRGKSCSEEGAFFDCSARMGIASTLSRSECAGT